MIVSPKKISLDIVFPTLSFDRVVAPNMSISGGFFEDDPDHEDLEKASKRLELFQKENHGALLANGYLEQRAFYNTPAFERTVNGTTEYRNIHLGTDFWIPAGTPVHAPFDGKVVISHNNDIHKDYGPTLVLKHELDLGAFYTLYGHLSGSSLSLSPANSEVKKGEQIGFIGDENENGHWVPHLHFQLITDLLGNTENFNGVAFPSELDRWTKLCPNPDLIFEEYLPSAKEL
ncbi:peptidoglycan DD-metalloendopeptidase family protein [Aureitalea sp. L0-47]|uniref:peptidoglycan DD-metalloendopeptidase family protein n=1 Tax=Aureitalea sp. L0-47 TaxID=2816962 RepID=UPI002238BC44|nr:peptidoglycan DD-metalloendopeptidase family protein [Aureitalea sp. L0-47]MCW5518592.1 peptidoglycan DD-metalloendopeptidase family protein [Aureitalea sp. L0-47]